MGVSRVIDKGLLILHLRRMSDSDFMRRYPRIDVLERYFDEINAEHFDGFLERPRFCWNPRLRASAGRFVPPARQALILFHWMDTRPTIEIATYLREEENGERHIRDTIAHEMIHYWLWVRKRPYGHNAEFWKKMREMGVSRYNPVPRPRRYRYVYRCPGCEREFPARKLLGKLACLGCCKRHNDGYYDARFKLILVREIPKGEEYAPSGPERGAEPSSGSEPAPLEK